MPPSKELPSLPMRPDSQAPSPDEDPVAWGRRLAERVAAVVARHPEADPEHVRWTLICLERSPDQRLARSLQRGRGFAAFRR